ncbi:MAG: hypothetical protein ACXVDN_04985 [Ktedonobacteraceae bacterium]
MNVVELLERYKQAPVSSERAFPAYPFPRKYVHCVIDSLEDAVKAVFALRVAGCATEDIHVMASWDFVEAFERLHQRKKGFYKVLKRLYAFMDEGFTHVYLHEARQGRHLLLVRLSGGDQLAQVGGDLLASHQAYLMKYVDTWTVTDLQPSRCENTFS